MLPILVVGWQAFALSGEEAGRFREVVGVSSLLRAVRVRGTQNLRSIEKCLAVLWMLASFLRCHSTTETLNLTVLEFRREGRRGVGAYVRDKNTSARLRAKNAGGRTCGTLR